jgi:large subunit ribosomal protein L4
MLKAQVISAKGIKTGTISLPAFSEDKPNLVLLSQAIRVYEDRSHPGLSKVKTRAEVNRTKKKWYRQKGTGGARHGAKSAPIFVGGGVAHGPKGIKRRLVLPVNIARKALRTAVSLKVTSGELFVVSGVASIKKTKDASDLLQKVGKNLGRQIKRAVFAISPENIEAKRAILNLEGVSVANFFDLNARSVYMGGVVLLDKDALSVKRPQKEVKEEAKVKEEKKEVKKAVRRPVVKKTRRVARKSK